jgi:hypothetical protein
MEPKTFKITYDPIEISNCEWIDLKEYFGYTHLRPVQLEAKLAVEKYLQDGKLMEMKDISSSNHLATIYKI